MVVLGWFGHSAPQAWPAQDTFFYQTNSRMNKIEIIPPGKTLYHGTDSKFKDGYPVGKNGIWFATNPIQSILHVAVRGKLPKKPMYFYIYKTVKPLKVLKFDSSKNMNNWAIRSGFPSNAGTYAFSNKDYQLATYLCERGVYDGWWFPNDQSQVMLCKPSELLKFVKVMEITFPYGRPNRIDFNKTGNTGKYIVSEEGRKYKYKLVNTTLNKLINIRDPPKNAIYSLRRIGNRAITYVNHMGKPLSITPLNILSPNGFNYNGKRYFPGTSSTMYGNQRNRLLERIKNTMKINVSPYSHNVSKVTLWTPNQRAAQIEKDRQYKEWRNKYIKYETDFTNRSIRGLPTNNLVVPKLPNIYKNNNKNNNLLPLPEPHKTMNNININASMLFGQQPRHRRKSVPVRYNRRFT
jgi:hypothetical protein